MVARISTSRSGARRRRSSPLSGRAHQTPSLRGPARQEWRRPSRLCSGVQRALHRRARPRGPVRCTCVRTRGAGARLRAVHLEPSVLTLKGGRWLGLQVGASPSMFETWLGQQGAMLPDHAMLYDIIMPTGFERRTAYCSGYSLSRSHTSPQPPSCTPFALPSPTFLASLVSLPAR